MLGFMIFLIFICFLFTYLVYGIYLSTVYKNDISYNDKGQPVDNKETMRWGFRFCIGISTVLLLVVTMFSSRVEMSDFWLALFLFATISGVTSLLISIYQRIRYRKNSFKKINRYSLILIVMFLLFIGITAETQDASSDESTAGVEESNDEADETAANQNNKTEEKVSEDEQKELEEKEKELDQREKELEEKEAQELAAKEKAEREEKQLAKEKEEKEEKEKQEQIAKEKKAKAKEKAEKEKAEADKGDLIPVDLYRVVDGDTVNVFDEQGEELKLRLLLIDTPETVHPNKPVEPFGPEASERLTELVNSGEQLYIEYDDGDKTDRYDRHLVYLYVGDTNVHEVLLEEGLARVGYIYEQQKYLEEFKEAEKIARDQQVGIWSIPDYVNEAGEGFNSEGNEDAVNSSTTNGSSSSESDESSVQSSGNEFFNNCTELRTVYPDGVSSDHAAYQSKMDRDNDGWACESNSSSGNNSSSSSSNNLNSEPAQSGGSEFFNNCTELRTVYPGGVASGHAAYQSKMDRDNDGWACE